MQTKINPFGMLRPSLRKLSLEEIDTERSRSIKKIIAEKLIETNPQTKAELDAFKRRICKEYKISYPSNIDLLAALKSCQGPASTRSSLKELLRVRPVRSLSGIVNVSVLTKPYPCPGTCLYCPNEPGFPKSYLSGEPAAERAKRLKFDPYDQTFKRIEVLKNEGHATDKIEMRIIGGTWSYYPKSYQKNFIALCFAACNDFPTFKKRKKLSLEAEQKKNETANCRIVGLSVETRPDYINKREIRWLRELGVTKVELGIQSIYDDVLQKNLRGHKVLETIRATKFLKDSGFKISYQIMLNLYGSNAKRDAEMLKDIFSNQNFQPDLIKLYPCAVLAEAPLCKLYKKGLFKPYSDKKIIEVIKTIKKNMPPYVRIERIIRDIPSPRIIKGAKTISNLRQIIAKDMARENWSCLCIRCREVKEGFDAKEKLFLIRRDYSASDGLEIFLSFENENRSKIFSLLRLRIPAINQPIFTVLKNAALIREIHTYGLQVPISEKRNAAQHGGLGKKLIAEAEQIAKKEFGYKKIVAISGVGARKYWRKFGYVLKESYLVKNLGG